MLFVLTTIPIITTGYVSVPLNLRGRTLYQRDPFLMITDAKLRIISDLRNIHRLFFYLFKTFIDIEQRNNDAFNILARVQEFSATPVTPELLKLESFYIPLLYHFPIDNRPESGKMIGTAVLIIQVIGMFPNVKGKQRS